MSGPGASGLHVPIERIQRRDPERRWKVAVPIEALADDGPMRVADVTVQSGTSVGLDLVIDRVSEGVEVTGQVTCRWVGPCSRCLEPVQGEVTAVVEELFTPVPIEGESYRLDEDRIDLGPMVRDAVLLELPISTVPCPHGDGCSNLPPQLAVVTETGGDERDVEDSDLGDPRWAVLDRLRGDLPPAEP